MSEVWLLASLWLLLALVAVLIVNWLRISTALSEIVPRDTSGDRLHRHGAWCRPNAELPPCAGCSALSALRAVRRVCGRPVLLLFE